jgi:CRISPR-associated endonuclease/helicase Cas3
VSEETRVEILPAEGKKKPKTRKIKEEFVEMGVMALRNALGATPHRATLAMPTHPTPVLMPAHVDLLSQTSPEPAVTPEASVYLHGPETGPADVHVVWRADLEPDSEKWCDVVAMCPPSAAEVLALPLSAVRQWLTQEGTFDVSDVEGGCGDTSRAQGEMSPLLSWRGVDDSAILKTPAEVRPGMTIVVRSQMGGCDQWGWNPESKCEVSDVGDAVKLRMGRPMLRLHENLASKWKYGKLAADLRKADQDEFGDVVEGIAVEEGVAPWVAEALTKLRNCRRKWIDDPVSGETWAAITGRAVFDQNDVRGSYGNVEIPLAEHLENCAGVANGFARELPVKLKRTVERAAALHDIGKADPRFQAWLRGGNSVKTEQLIAKSKRSGQNRVAIELARRMAGYPQGARHELMSTALLTGDGGDSSEVDFDLLLHLVASHHGRCRPFAPVVKDGDPVTVRHEGRHASSDHGLERVGSGVTERFWKLTRRYGWYGLAYLEAMVRLADQRQSEAEQNRSGEGGS